MGLVGLLFLSIAWPPAADLAFRAQHRAPLRSGHYQVLYLRRAVAGLLLRNNYRLSREVADCVLQSGIELPHRAIMANIGNAVDLLIHIGRVKGQRTVSEIVAVQGFDNEKNECRFEVLNR